MELKLFHSMLKLCGLLSKDHVNWKHFEEKFSLPFDASSCDRNVLEAYFIRREKIINFCRDFRLRRYRHQYEDLLPLVIAEEYEKSLKLWKENAIRASSLPTSSDSVKIISSSDRDTEELFESFFVTKEERKLNKEIAKIMSDKSIVRRESDSEDTIMPPLLFVSDSEDDTSEKQEEQQIVCNTRSENEENERNTVRSNEIMKSSNIRRKSKKRRSTPACNNFTRQTRSDGVRITRSAAHRNKFLVSNISENIKRINQISKKSRRSIKKENINENKNKSKNEELENFQKSLSEESKYDFKIDLINKSMLQDAQNATEVQFITPSADELVVLSNSSIGEENKSDDGNAKRNVSPSPDLFTTTMNGDDYNITCTQNKSSSKSNVLQTSSKSWMVMLGENFQKDETKSNNNSKSGKKGEEIIFEISTMTNKHDKNNVSNAASSNNVLTQVRNKIDNNNHGNNKITKYLIGAIGSSSSSLSSFDDNDTTTTTTTTTTNETEKIQYRRNSEIYHRTPKRQKLLKRLAVTSGKKSPRTNSNNLTPNGLTKWLIKSTSSSEVKSPKKNVKRRRLDVSFQNL